MHAITIQSLQLSYLLQASAHSTHFILHTVFLRPETAATIYFAARFVWLLFEGGYYSWAVFISLESLETLTMAG